MAVETSSFTSAANLMYVSQPAVSKQIISMEEELGVKLFERKNKKLFLTEAGKLFADYYRGQQASFNSLTRNIKNRNEQSEIPIRLTIGKSWALSHIFPGIIQNVQKQFPNAAVYLEDNDFFGLEDILADNRADIIITFEFALCELPQVEKKRLVKLPRSIIYSDKYQVGKSGKLNPQDFSDALFIIPKSARASSIADIVHSFIDPYGFVPKLRFVDSIGSAAACVANGIGVMYADVWCFSGVGKGFNQLLLREKSPVCVAWKKKNDNPAVQLFLEELFSLPEKILLQINN